MSIRFISCIVFLLSNVFTLIAQNPLHHEKKVYVSPEGKVFVNKALPIYVKISVSPDPHAPTYTLPSVVTAQYANPMYFDTEGRNTLRSPWAVDTATKKPIDPKREIIFEVYADDIPPVTQVNIKHKHRFIKNGITYFDKSVELEFTSSDAVSGTEATYVSIDKGVYENYAKAKPVFDIEKPYMIAYYSVDRVGNAEKPKFINFSIDLTPPRTDFKIIGDSKGKMLSSKASIQLTARDSLSGVNRIVYSINGGTERIYTVPIALSLLQDGKSKITYYAVDNIGNKEEPRVIATSTDRPDDHSESSEYSFYVDKEPPVVDYEIAGDKCTGKYLYISSRSQFKINATDDKSGVDKVMYSINNPLLNLTYVEPFALKGEGLQTIFYSAADNVGNVALPKSQLVYVDKYIPVTTLNFIGRKFTNRDTTFITGETKISLSASEIGSGIQATEFTLDGAARSVYTGPFTVKQDGFHTLAYFSSDKVNNIEPAKKRSFIVDNTPPVVHYNFSVKAIGEKTVRDKTYSIYPSNTMLYIAATDNAAGVERIEYQINGKPPQDLIPIKGLLPGNYEIEITAYDMLSNKSVETVHFAVEN